MKRLRKALAMAAVALVMGSLAAGCGQGGGAVGSAISSLSPSRSPSVSLPSRSPSAAPETQAPPTSEAPETAAATEPAQAASTAPAGGSGSSLLWLWIVLGAVIVIGVIAWIVRASGRRSAAAAGWRSRMIDTYAKGQALADGLRIADAPGAPAAADAGARWADLQARADDLTQELYRLRESAPGEEDRDRAADALASLRALRSAMAEEQAAGRAGGAGSPEAAQVRSRLLAFEASIRALRAADEQLPRI
ncbi:MAG TPA: hypothetical protein VF256_11960 [Streptosporangiaceae bacterium]